MVWKLLASVLAGIGMASSAETTASELLQLRNLLLDQQRQIDELRRRLDERTEPAAPLPPTPAPPDSPPAKAQSPAALRLGDSTITPIGFLDFTAVFRDTAAGSGIGTNFGSFPYRTPGNPAGNLSEFRFSAQNSRIGARLDTRVRDVKVAAHWESDFLGFTPGNAAVSSNSNSFRLRLYWVQLTKGKFEFLGGQSWSMITPGRVGISPVPQDLFYTGTIDVNYHAGLPWARTPQARIVYHASDAVSLGLSLESPEQYIGGSGGGGTAVLPSALVKSYANLLNDGTTTLTVPNLRPDIIAKIAVDPKVPNGRQLHFEAAGMERTFKTYNPLTARPYTKAGFALQANLHYELFTGFRVLTNNYWSDGGGRYLFGAAPDVVVRSDGSVAPLHSMGTVTGIEYARGRSLFYVYYGGVYAGRDTVEDPSNGNLVGYGYTGSSTSQNRAIHEASIGFSKFFWRDPRWGGLALQSQYAYFSRSPWSAAVGTPRNTHMNEVLLNLRYQLPGATTSLRK
jgi:hypothetical protein